MKSNLQLAKNLVGALGGAVSAEALAVFFAPDAVGEFYASTVRAVTVRASGQELIDALLTDQGRFVERQLSVRGALASGDAVVLELDWHGATRTLLGSATAGERRHGRAAWFCEFRGGRILRLRCYESAEPSAG